MLQSLGRPWPRRVRSAGRRAPAGSNPAPTARPLTKLVAVPVLALGLIGCGGGGADGAVATAAQENAAQLTESNDVRDFEVLSVQDGSITSLREVVDGDRPVLLWFWAPH